jgi:hypothetical protein
MDDGIIEVKLLPLWDRPSIRGALNSALSQCQLLQAGIAYWTVKDSMFGACLSSALRHASGFQCVDIHPPTDIDALAELVKKGCHVHLNCEEVPTLADVGAGS